jgi:hypothetical protein
MIDDIRRIFAAPASSGSAVSSPEAFLGLLRPRLILSRSVRRRWRVARRIAIPRLLDERPTMGAIPVLSPQPFSTQRAAMRLGVIPISNRFHGIEASLIPPSRGKHLGELDRPIERLQYNRIRQHGPERRWRSRCRASVMGSWPRRGLQLDLACTGKTGDPALSNTSATEPRSRVGADSASPNEVVERTSPARFPTKCGHLSSDCSPDSTSAQNQGGSPYL